MKIRRNPSRHQTDQVRVCSYRNWMASKVVWYLEWYNNTFRYGKGTYVWKEQNEKYDLRLYNYFTVATLLLKKKTKGQVFWHKNWANRTDKDLKKTVELKIWWGFNSVSFFCTVNNLYTRNFLEFSNIFKCTNQRDSSNQILFKFWKAVFLLLYFLNLLTFFDYEVLS